MSGACTEKYSGLHGMTGTYRGDRGCVQGLTVGGQGMTGKTHGVAGKTHGVTGKDMVFL